MNDTLIFLIAMFIVVLLGLGVFVLAGNISKSAKVAKKLDEDIAARGVATEAKIINKRSRTYSEGNDRYFLEYQYQTTGNASFTKVVEVSRADYNRLNVGDPLALRYLPDNPNAVHIESAIVNVNSAGNLQSNSKLLYVFGAFIMGIVIVGSGAMLNFRQRDAQATATQIARSATPGEAEKKATAAAATATLQAAAVEVRKISALMAAYLPDWKKVSDQVRHTVMPPQTAVEIGGLQIDYGYCQSGHFYVYVWTLFNYSLNDGSTTYRDMDGYAYVEGSQPPDCYPKEMASTWLGDVVKLDNDWYSLSNVTEVVKK